MFYRQDRAAGSVQRCGEKLFTKRLPEWQFRSFFEFINEIELSVAHRSWQSCRAGVKNRAGGRFGGQRDDESGAAGHS